MAKWAYVKDKFRKHRTASVRLPERSTSKSAGYDIYAPCDITVPAYSDSPLIFMDIKAKIEPNQVLLIFPRSSFGVRGITLANTVGVIDADYYNNPTNDGNIGLQFRNSGSDDFHMGEGGKIAQAVLVNYETFENGNLDNDRTGGFGSTGA